jgi:ribosomal protein L40E
MTDTTCPSCDAPAPAGARRCSRCGYRFVEGGPRLRRRPSLTPAAVGGTALALVTVAALLALNALGTGDDGGVARSSPTQRHLAILSDHPLGTSATERLLERRYLGARDDESAWVQCSGRVPKPAHSVRRCIVHYPGGVRRGVALFTRADGAEVISKP